MSASAHKCSLAAVLSYIKKKQKKINYEGVVNLFNKIKEKTGLALRFPKFTGKIRTEKNAEDASTDEEVIALYKVQKKTVTPE
mgnify:CR=1 FL=1